MRIDEGVAVVLKKDGMYGVLKREKNWSGWEIPKGHLELGSYDATVLIELYEEAGIKPVDIVKMEKKDEKLEFEFEGKDERIKSSFQVYVVEVEEETELVTELNPSDEHSDSKFVSREEAVSLLEYKEQVDLVERF